ncbi:MAG: glycosyltransferase, partial [Phycisphaeraceae bacterium]
MNRDASPQQSQRAAEAQPLRVGYLVNQYPAISHTFIRREIAALEWHNVTVQRYSIRPSDAGGNAFPDPRDEREQQITRSILSGGLKGLAVALLREAASNTRQMSRALALTWRVWRKSKASLPLHLAYLAEACVLHRWTAEEDLDHVHAHFATNSATVAMFCRELGGPPYSFTVHGPEEFDRAVILAMDDKIAKSAFVVAITHYCRSQLMRWCALEHWDKLRLIRCGLA